MSQNPRGLTPLNWQSYVDEALRRRKQEHLTQREHAALANVSLPTIAAFERAETTLSLAKAFDILRVVGLLDEPKPEDAHDRFVRDAFKRWQSLAETLPADSPGRFPHGWFRFDYQLVGELRKVGLAEFEGILRNATKALSALPSFSLFGGDRPEISEIDGVLECSTDYQNLQDAGRHRHQIPFKFWRASPSGSLFVIHGYDEDRQETFAPRTILDTNLPIWRTAEALIHAQKVAYDIFGLDGEPTAVNFRAIYSGLSGRVLKSWSNPFSSLLFEGHAADGDASEIQLSVRSEEIYSHIYDHVWSLTHELYARFGASGLSLARIRHLTEELLERIDPFPE
jgi:transcriptional regulator with XRE-family HTH domain